MEQWIVLLSCLKMTFKIVKTALYYLLSFFIWHLKLQRLHYMKYIRLPPEEGSTACHTAQFCDGGLFFLLYILEICYCHTDVQFYKFCAYLF